MFKGFSKKKQIVHVSATWNNYKPYFNQTVCLFINRLHTYLKNYNWKVIYLVYTVTALELLLFDRARKRKLTGKACISETYLNSIDGWNENESKYSDNHVCEIKY